MNSDLTPHNLLFWPLNLINCFSFLLLLTLGVLNSGPINPATVEAAQERVIKLTDGSKVFVGTPKVVYMDGRFEVTIDLRQESKQLQPLRIPVKFYTLKGEYPEILNLDQEKSSFKILLSDEPLKMVIDEDQQLPRRLSEGELMPGISQLFREKAYLVVSEKDRDLYDLIIKYLKERNPQLELKPSSDKFDLKESYIFFGRDNPDLQRFFGPVKFIEADFSITVKRNPWAPEKAIGIVTLKKDEDIARTIDLMGEVRESSAVAISGGKVIMKEIETQKRGIEIELRRPPHIVEPKKSLTLEAIIERISDKKIIYIGEYHDRVSHHYLQRQIIEELLKKDPRIAIGMEMFQRPFQQVLDEYINKKIEEREFLKQTEYFKRWGFDYNLYKPILDLAREKTIPVIALNLRREITEKVSKSGIESLTEEEKGELPEELDFSDDEYRDRLKEIFRQHKREEGNFDYFYQSQILWDETMAMSIDQFFKKAPEYKLVVLAGGGHIAHGSGIPKRAFRRNRLPYAIILIDAELEKDIADFIIYPEPLEGITAPKLMVSLKEEAAGLRVVELPEESPSRKAGIKKGDIIIKIDDTPVSTVEDLRIHLFYKKTGDAVKVTVRRRYLLIGEKEKEFLVKF